MESTSFSSDWTELLAAFNAAGARYLVIGAYAYGRYALPHSSGDLDLWIDRDAENASHAFAALSSFGAPLGGLSPEDFTAADFLFRFGRPPLGIDVVTSISGVTFQEAWSSRVVGELGGIQVYFLSREDFLRNKRASGRRKDLVDADEVEKFGRH